ncbi:hypothetical protein [Holophaga foetida]|uniref:hypothetical protein n=1 Tax=Holophaga foetida TaxID=35839 RepID=UPI0002472F5F|nr:hypothetical protein [Holophaga foetida]
MKSWALSGLTLLSLLGCDRAKAPVPFGPGEAGLVLGYENPSLPEAQRTSERLQLRVDATAQMEGGLDVRTTLSTLRGQASQRLFLRRGGVAIWDGKTILQTILPEGFPQVQTWETKDAVSRLLGRSTAEAGTPLPPGSDRIGYWVETQDKAKLGIRIRSFYVPEVGVTETRIWQDGRWVTIQRLNSRMFADAPRPE